MKNTENEPPAKRSTGVIVVLVLIILLFQIGLSTVAMFLPLVGTISVATPAVEHRL